MNPVRNYLVNFVSGIEINYLRRYHYKLKINTEIFRFPISYGMKITQSTIFFIIVIVLVLGAIITFMSTNTSPASNGKYDAFATCLKDEGAVFYGTWWCSHCNATKKLFGSSEKLLPYVECSSPDGNEQLQVCKDKNIEGYPTWEFADGSRLSGELSFQTLSEKTSCPLPE